MLEAGEGDIVTSLVSGQMTNVKDAIHKDIEANMES